MSGYKGHKDSKPSREIFLTSTSLSFSSLASSRASWDDDTIDLTNAKDRSIRSVDEVHKAKQRLQGSSQDSGVSGVTNVRMEPSPTPSRLGSFDPERIPSSVFEKTEDSNWSEVSNDSLFSLRMSNCQQQIRKSKVKLEDVEFLAFDPPLQVKHEDDAEEEKEKTKSFQEKTLSSASALVVVQASPIGFEQLFLAPASTKIPLSKNMKKKKKMKKKRRKEDCCIWSWLCLGIITCERDLGTKWRNRGCCCSKGPTNAMVM